MATGTVKWYPTLCGFATPRHLHCAIKLGCNSYRFASSATVRWPCMASSATLALNSAVKRLRVFMSDGPSRRPTLAPCLRDPRQLTSPKVWPHPAVSMVESGEVLMRGAGHRALDVLASPSGV